MLTKSSLSQCLESRTGKRKEVVLLHKCFSPEAKGIERIQRDLSLPECVFECFCRGKRVGIGFIVQFTSMAT